ncbi:MAG: NADH-quinone oxidoreductase subunit H [Campylobacterota bacterium]|nr:NADH-quinone oxidoreductase subunit H [Campylobacterota bacterium]
MVELLLDILYMIVLAYGFGFLYYGLYRNISARVHGRFGPSIAQSFFDSIKLFVKKSSTTFGWMFYAGPVIMASGAILTVLFIPFLNNTSNLSGLSSYGNLILILYLMVLGPLGNALGVGSTGNPFNVMGVTRGLTRLIGLELPFYIAIIGLIAINKSSDISVIMANQENTINMIQHPLLFIAAFISFLGFMGKSPFDVVGAPQEVYSGPRAEFSGKFLALAMSQSAIFSFAKLLLMVNLFLGGASSLAELVVKTFVLFLVAVFTGNVFARFTTSQSVEFLLIVPTSIALLGLVFI